MANITRQLLTRKMHIEIMSPQAAFPHHFATSIAHRWNIFKSWVSVYVILLTMQKQTKNSQNKGITQKSRL